MRVRPFLRRDRPTRLLKQALVVSVEMPPSEIQGKAICGFAGSGGDVRAHEWASLSVGNGDELARPMSLAVNSQLGHLTV
jgi:hypothetical protein